MVINKYILWTLMLLFSMVIISCDDDEPVIPDEPELITTLTYTLVPASGGDAIVLSFQDLDGDGGAEPMITGGTLAQNESYTGTIELLNETEDPAENITEEIEEEDEDHQFFFQSDLADLTFSYNDQDSEGNPIGLSTTLNTVSAGSGSFRIILRHEPAKSAENVSEGDITNAGGETDIEVTFPLNVQ